MKRKPGARNIAGIFVILLWLSGCSGTPQVALLSSAPPGDIPAQRELLEVPFFPQQEFYCAPASLAAIFEYLGREVSPDELGARMVVPELQGSLQTEVVATIRAYDLVPFRQDGQVVSLLREIDRGNPVFLLQNLGLDSLPSWHYEVLIGYDLEREVMILRSDVHRRIERDFKVFERTWTRAGNWSLVVLPPDMMPVSVSETAYLDEAVAFEQLGRLNTAAQLYDNASMRWPENIVAWLGKGNLHYGRQDYPSAEAAYQRALAIEPQRAALWNNLAFSLIQQGQRAAALDAIDRAIGLEPDNPNYANSRTELINWP